MELVSNQIDFDYCEYEDCNSLANKHGEISKYCGAVLRFAVNGETDFSIRWFSNDVNVKVRDLLPKFINWLWNTSQHYYARCSFMQE